MPIAARNLGHDDHSIINRAIQARRAVRRFQPAPVMREVIEDILAAATWAPSATNTQPWRVYVLAGAARERLCDAVLTAFDTGDTTPAASAAWFGQYADRRRNFGARFYGHLGIDRHEAERRRAQQRRNFAFYDAPVGLVFTIDRRLDRGSWLDCGMFLQNVMILAHARGLGTCPQGSWNDYAHVVAQVLELPEHEMLVCGMALGHCEPDAIEVGLNVGREPITTFARFDGFE